MIDIFADRSSVSCFRVLGKGLNALGEEVVVSSFIRQWRKEIACTSLLCFMLLLGLW